MTSQPEFEFNTGVARPRRARIAPAKPSARPRVSTWQAIGKTTLLPGLVIAAVVLLTASPALAQLRIVTYNSATRTNAGDTPRAGMSDVLAGLGIESKNGIQRPVDILSIQETGTGLNGAQQMMNLLNSIYGAGTYARSTMPGASTDGSTQAVIYNTQTVQLISQASIGAASTSGAPRAPLRFEFRPVGYDDSADFYLYSSHYKAGDTGTDQTRRAIEAATVRADADALGVGARVIFTGDFNIQSSGETMYQTLTGPAGGDGRAFDPINSPGSWHDNASFAAIHTQSPGFGGGGLAGGGMDDRFDFQLVTSELLQGQGMSYIGTGVPNTLISPSQHSYHAFGNNGTTFNNSTASPANTALPISEYNPGVGEPSRTTVLNSLTTASDHLPVVADYQLPAKMDATLGSVPSQVIKDTPLSVGVQVSNVAPVAVAIGADELSYNYSGSGAASGGGAGSPLLVFDAPNSHNLSLDTGTLGPQVGNVKVTGTSEQVANGTFNGSVNYTVLDHAAGDFIGATGVQTLDIDFGNILVGVGTVQEDFQLTNLAGAFRADLDFNSFVETGDVFNRFATDLSPFAGLAAGSVSGLFNVSLAIDQVGAFSATYLLSVADQAGILGGTGDTLTLNVYGNVIVPEPASMALAGMALAVMLAACARRRRRK